MKGEPQEELGHDRDLCKSLNSAQICRPLKDASNICRPAKWLAESLQETVVLTLRLVRDVQNSFNIILKNKDYSLSLQKFIKIQNSASTQNKKSNEKQNSNDVQFNSFKLFSIYFIEVCSFLTQIILFPIMFFNLTMKKKQGIQDYLSFQLKGNMYIDKWIIAYDDYYSKFFSNGYQLMPLKNFENKCLTDKTKLSLSKIEKKDVLKSLGIYGMYSSITLLFVAIDFLLFFATSLKPAKHHLVLLSEQQNDINLIPILSQVSFKVAELLEDLWRLVQIGILSGRNNSRSETPISLEDCQLRTDPPSFIYLIFVSLLLSLCLLTTITNPYASRFEDTIIGFYYPGTKLRRVKYLYNDILRKRKQNNYHNKLNAIENLNHYLNKKRKKLNPEEKRLKIVFIDSSFKWIENNFWFNYCFVCQETSYHLRACPSNSCQIRICPACLEDHHHTCPLCCSSPASSETQKNNNNNNNDRQGKTEECSSYKRPKQHYIACGSDHNTISHSFSKCVSSYYGSVDNEDFL